LKVILALIKNPWSLRQTPNNETCYKSYILPPRVFPEFWKFCSYLIGDKNRNPALFLNLGFPLTWGLAASRTVGRRRCLIGRAGRWRQLPFVAYARYKTSLRRSNQPPPFRHHHCRRLVAGEAQPSEPRRRAVPIPAEPPPP
jgi:hypothetical protein